MTIALISDIHGNLAALQAVIAEIDRLGVNDIVCLGDVAGYYPDLDACADILRERAIPCLLGNHDDYIARGIPCPRSDAANRCLDLQRSRLRTDTLEWLQSLACTMRHGELHLVHAGWNDPLDEYMTPSSNYFLGIAGRVFASGHSHVQYAWTDGSRLYCNPGSVGQPRDGNPASAFAIWTGKTFELRRVPYAIEKTEQAMGAAGFPLYFYENLRKGSRIGGQIDQPPIIRSKSHIRSAVTVSSKS